jgi:flagellar biosynthesis protein FlhG
MVSALPDQAAGLRQARESRPVKVIAVTGGKGGVGKTVATINLGTALAEHGRRVMLLDADLGLANVDLLLGLRAELNLEHVVNGECELEEVVVTAASGLQVLPASSGSVSMANLDYAGQAGLISAFGRLLRPIDTLLIDTASGLGHSVLTFSGAAQRVVVVVCDEPTSLTDAYGLIKVLCRRQPDTRIEVLANMTGSPAQGRDLFEKLARVSHRFLGVSLAYLGSVPYDEHLRRAVQRQMAVVEAYPGSAAARAFRNIALATDRWTAPAAARGGLEFFLERLVDVRRSTGANSIQ